MNRLKLMHDVVKTLRDKEEVQGTLQLKGEKNQVQIFSFANEFSRNLQTGATLAKISTQYDCNGKQVKHESQTEFNFQDGQKHPMFHGFKGHFHRHGQGHGHGQCHQPGEHKPLCFRDKLNRIAQVLNILNQISITEQEDKSLLLSFNSNDLPPEMQQVFREKMQRHHNPEHLGEHHHFLKEFGHITTSSIVVKMRINAQREIEQVCIAVDGEGDSQEMPQVKFQGELNLVW